MDIQYRWWWMRVRAPWLFGYWLKRNWWLVLLLVGIGIAIRSLF